jgi:hypothetical protein
MKTLALLLSLVPSVALAHPGHDDVGVGGTSAAHAAITNPVIVIALCVVVTLAVARVYRMVRK